MYCKLQLPLKPLKKETVYTGDEHVWLSSLHCAAVWISTGNWYLSDACSLIGGGVSEDLNQISSMMTHSPSSSSSTFHPDIALIANFVFIVGFEQF